VTVCKQVVLGINNEVVTVACMFETETWPALLHKLVYDFVQVMKISKRVCTPLKEPGPESKCGNYTIQYI